MNYSGAFDDELRELEDTAIHLATCETVVRHVEEGKRIWKARDHASTASKHVDTVHQAFLATVCEDYEPIY